MHISNHTPLLQVKMDFFSEKHWKTNSFRNFRRATIKQNSHSGRHTAAQRPHLSPLGRGSTYISFAPFRENFYVERSKALKLHVYFIFWALHIYLSLREQCFSSLWTSGEEPKNKRQPLGFLLRMRFLCGLREDYEYSMIQANMPWKVHPVVCRVYFSPAFLAFNKYWKGDIRQTLRSHPAGR